MQKYFQTVKDYIADHKKQFKLGSIITLGVLVIAGIVGLLIYNATPRYVYQPVNACELFTLQEAEELLGKDVVFAGSDAPVVSYDRAISKCGYTDKNSDIAQKITAAVAVRSGIDDKGVQQNSNDFAVGKANKNNTPVKDLGDDAYFNPSSGQLNVLSGREWVIISYGLGQTPQDNTLEQALQVAHKVL